MPRQLKLPLGNYSSHQFKPIAHAQQGARRYAESQGMNWAPPNSQIQQDPQRRAATAQAYKRAQGGAEIPEIKRSYEAMRQHVQSQYEFMTKPEHEGGMGISVETTPQDPYSSHKEMAEDLRANRRLKVLSTEATGPHAYFSNEENDRFRAVHDVFGHGAAGRGFSRHGEEAAYLSHQQMFPPEAHAALTSETRGQNSYLNTEGSFPEQGSKLIGLPKWAESNIKGEYGQAKPKQQKPQGQQQRLGL